MEDFKEILEKFESMLKEFNYPILNYLQEGKRNSSYDDVAELFKNLKFAVRNDIVEMYSWKNGVKGMYENPVHNLELFPNGIMLPFEYAVSSYALEVKSQKLFGKEYFPLFASGGGDYILMNMDDTKKSYGQLFLFSPSVLLTSKPVSIYDTLSTLFETLLEIYYQKGYYFNGNGLEIDYDIEKEVSMRMNPNSKFWVED